MHPGAFSSVRCVSLLTLVAAACRRCRFFRIHLGRAVFGAASAAVVLRAGVVGSVAVLPFPRGTSLHGLFLELLSDSFRRGTESDLVVAVIMHCRSQVMLRTCWDKFDEMAV